MYLDSFVSLFFCLCSYVVSASAFNIFHFHSGVFWYLLTALASGLPHGSRQPNLSLPTKLSTAYFTKISYDLIIKIIRFRSWRQSKYLSSYPIIPVRRRLSSITYVA